METKITEAEAKHKIALANSTGAGIAKAIEARKTLLRWAALPSESFENEGVALWVRNAAGFWRS